MWRRKGRRRSTGEWKSKARKGASQRRNPPAPEVRINPPEVHMRLAIISYSRTLILDSEYNENLSRGEKRRFYKCKSRFVTLDDIETWKDTRNCEFMTYDIPKCNFVHVLFYSWPWMLVIGCLHYIIMRNNRCTSTNTPDDIQPLPFARHEGLLVAWGHHMSGNRRHSQHCKVKSSGRGWSFSSNTQCGGKLPA